MIPESIYQIWHYETFAAKGQRVRSVVNFENAKSKTDWSEFVKFAGMLERNKDSVSATLFIRALAHFWNGYFPPTELNNRKSVTIYRDYIANQQAQNDPDKILNGIVESICFIADWCVERKVIDFDEYLHLNKELIPPLALHFDNGSITIDFLAMIENAPAFLKTAYPTDIVNDYFSKFIFNFEALRTKVVRVTDLKDYAKMSELKKLVNATIKKKLGEKVLRQLNYIT